MSTRSGDDRDGDSGPIRGFEVAVSQGNLDEAAATLANDFTAIDNRPLGYPEMDKAAFLEARIVRVEGQDRRVLATEEVHAQTDAVSLRTVRSSGTWSLGAEYERSWLMIILLERSLIKRIEVYAIDAFEEAFASFELHAALHDPLTQRPPDRP